MNRPDGTRERLGSRHVRRSASIVSDATAMAAYMGICSKCPRPVRAEVADGKSGGEKYTQILCPDCGTGIKGERLFAITSELDCDSTCLGAWGPTCTCGCGGSNHGRHWGMRLADAREILEHELERYRDHRAQVELAALKRELDKRLAAKNTTAHHVTPRKASSSEVPW